MTLEPKRETRQAKALWGTMRATINNMVVGVSDGFKRSLQINGVNTERRCRGTSWF